MANEVTQAITDLRALVSQMQTVGSEFDSASINVDALHTQLDIITAAKNADDTMITELNQTITTLNAEIAALKAANTAKALKALSATVKNFFDLVSPNSNVVSINGNVVTVTLPKNPAPLFQDFALNGIVLQVTQGQ